MGQKKGSTARQRKFGYRHISGIWGSNQGSNGLTCHGGCHGLNFRQSPPLCQGLNVAMEASVCKNLPDFEFDDFPSAMISW